jgi:hypothetical protein
MWVIKYRILGFCMFGSDKKTRNVNFVQPLQGEAYFCTPIAYSIKLPNAKEEGKQVFKDSDLALAGKLKLIFEREKMNWFEVREEKSPTQAKDERLFQLYYFPHRLVSGRPLSLDEQATLDEVQRLFDFVITKDQTRFAEVQQLKSPSPYGSIPKII